MIAAIDVYYPDDGSAVAGTVIFKDYTDSREYRKYTCHIPKTEAYIPGEFYKRELPCIMAALEMIIEDIDTVIIKQGGKNRKTHHRFHGLTRINSVFSSVCLCVIRG